MAQKLTYFLILLILLITFLDIFFALRNPFLETNPLILKLGFPILTIFKVGFALLISYYLYRSRYKNEAQLFAFCSTVMILIVVWGYGAFSGLYGGYQYENLEEEVVEQKSAQIEQMTGEKPSPVEVEGFKEQLKATLEDETGKIAIPYYTKLIWLIGIYPYLYSLVVFAVYERLLKSAIFKKRRQK